MDPTDFTLPHFNTLTRKDFTLQEGTLICQRARSGVSKALFHPDIASESHFELESHLVLFSHQLRQENSG